MWINWHKKRGVEPDSKENTTEPEGETMKYIGFYGYEQYEIIAWLSTLLRIMEKKVLIVDFTDEKELTNFIRLPRKIADDTDKVFEYHGMNYLIPSKNVFSEMECFHEYDVVLIDFGGKTCDCRELALCDALLFVTDMSLSHIALIKTMKKRSGCTNEYLILKHFISGTVDPEVVVDELSFDPEEVFVLEYDLQEEMQLFAGQHLDDFKMTVITASTRRFLYDMLLRISGANQSHISNSIKIATKGRR